MQRTNVRPLQFAQQVLIRSDIDVELLSNFNLGWGTVKLTR
jgi:hypothetical protein